MIIYVKEEYGYRFWRWDYPGNSDQLIHDWKSGAAPLDFFDPSKPIPGHPYKGTMTQLRTEASLRLCREHHDAFAHIHETDDTYLRVNNLELPHPCYDPVTDRSDDDLVFDKFKDGDPNNGRP